VEHPEPTGDPAVDAALVALETLAGRPLAEHVAVVDSVQSALAERLAETDG
jgi:hypothetical protein